MSGLLCATELTFTSVWLISGGDPEGVVALALLARYLPQATPLDPAEDPPSSTDPLGTLAPAERIAEVLLPGFTARMWRPRLLTFTAVASLVADRVEGLGTGHRGNGLAVRLGFERLFVSALVREAESAGNDSHGVASSIPGITLARRALRSGDTPLSQNNFLKGQAVNGPFGVMARLARHLRIVDEDDRLARNGEELLLAWSADVGLVGLLDEERSDSSGQKWLDRIVKATRSHVTDKQWPSSMWLGWRELVGVLRPDRIGRRERAVVRRLLDDHPVRARCLNLLEQRRAVVAYRKGSESGRGLGERQALLDGVLPALSPHQRHEDKVIDLSVRLADAYEGVASRFEAVFNGLLWGLTQRGGQATLEELRDDRKLRPVWRTVCRQLGPLAERLQETIKEIPSVQEVADLNPVDPLHELANEAREAVHDPDRLIGTVMARHQRIQNSKGKGVWIDAAERWTLLPGFGRLVESPPDVAVGYVHPFRVQNAYSFLKQLGLRGGF